ncbi:MAG: type III restriction endonuclease subunit R [Proteobacteria bacterium]|nr:MAG: type III restriction endonuclease subunit R [Pseudomonadota bacterium]
MKLKFENQAFQLDAIASTVNLFDGMYTIALAEQLANQNEILSYDIVANGLQIDNQLLLNNLQTIQLANNLENYSTELHYGDYNTVPNFSIEMETGTGKTYVYLRTVFELNKRYGLTKFIIVVPSDAIRTGVLKSLEITKEHFKSEYNNVSYDYYQYDSDKISKVRDFATTNSIQIMVMTIAAFNKSSNNIKEFKDKFGEYRPIDLIAATKPIVMIDEPQSVDNTENAKNAIKELNPLFILRYSATHREAYNQIYKLDAIDAYNQKLVKQIEVASIEDADSANLESTPYIKVIDISAKLELSLELDVQNAKGKISRKILKKIAKGTDLQQKTNNDIYYGYVVEDFSRDYGLKLSNLDREIEIGEAIGNEVSEELKTSVMLRLAIENHIKKELAFSKLNIKIKVLSLFFINKVADYRLHDNDTDTDGWLAKLFIEQLKLVLQSSDGKRYIDLCRKVFNLDLEQDSDLAKLHDGYFAKDKKGGYKDSKEDTQDSVDAYRLIMQDKEKLLDRQIPLRFIFSHSALKEGWDNPNVFQVCVLQESSNTFKRRQQVGRGLRLCVNSFGERVKDERINTLTIIAGESYNSFAANLQLEYETDVKIKFGNVHPLVFASQILKNNTELTLQDAKQLSSDIHEVLKVGGLINDDNQITEKCKKLIKINAFELSDDKVKPYESLVAGILTKLTNKLPIKNQRNKCEIKLNNTVYLSPEFKALWKRISPKTIYSVELDSEQLIQTCITEINNQLQVDKQSLKIVRAKLIIDDSGIASELQHQDLILLNSNNQIDCVSKIVLATGLMRNSVITILQNISDFKRKMMALNATAFTEQVSDIINHVKTKLIIDGIKYHKISDLNLDHSDTYYEQKLIENILDHGYREQNGDTNIANANDLGINPDELSKKFLFDVLRYDSQVEFDFLRDALTMDKVKLIAKLPAWFKVNTPLGKYNPDWALLIDKDGSESIYFIAETKDANFMTNGRTAEKIKTECGKLHFIEALDVDYQVVSKFTEIITKC